MDNKYIVNKNENGKITWISIENSNGEVEIKKIKNIENNKEYMDQLRAVNSKYDDFFNKFIGGEYSLEKQKHFEKQIKQAQNKEERKAFKEKKQSNNSLAKKVAALSMAAVLAVTSIGCGIIKKSDLQKSSSTSAKMLQVDEENPKLNAIYEELLKTENGKILVKELKETDKWQRDYNNKINKYKDANGDVLFLKAREVAAVQDISNAENTDFISLDYDETRFCDYLAAGAVTHKGLYVSEESTEEYKLIHDKDTKNEMKNEEDFALSAIKGKKTTKEIDKHFDELMETGLTYTASGVNVAYLGEGSNIVVSDEGRSSKKLAQFIEKVKTNNNGANKLDSYAKSKDVTKTERKLIDKAWKEMDKQNINVDLKSRDDFEMATTEKGLRKSTAKVAVNGGYLINSGGTYTYVTSTGKTIKVSRAEAIKKFGSSAVKKAENKADANVKVDTDGDGKKDTSMNEANKNEENKKDQLEEEARNYERDYAQGQADGYAGRSKAKNTPGYNAGYANGKLQREAENEPDEIIEKKEEYTSSPSEEKTPSQPEEKSVEPAEETTSRQKVVQIETYENNNESTTEMTMEDGTTYESSTKVRVRS